MYNYDNMRDRQGYLYSFFSLDKEIFIESFCKIYVLFVDVKL